MTHTQGRIPSEYDAPPRTPLERLAYLAVWLAVAGFVAGLLILLFL